MVPETEAPLVGEDMATVGGRATPVADREMEAGELVALLATVTLPITLPADSGANATFIVADWLGARMVPDVTPLAVNPVPVAVTLEIVTFEFPLFVSVALKEPVFATFTFPKLRLVGFAPSR